MKKPRPFLYGTVILTTANLFSRFLGFYIRIFLASLIGAHQMGVYQLIFPIYLVGFALCFHGFQTALSSIVATKHVKGNTTAAKQSLHITSVFTGILSLFFILFIYLFSKPICLVLLKDKSTIICLKVAVLALPFVGIKSCIHSYFIGLGKSGLPASSLCIEQISRAISIFVISISFFAKLPTAALLAVIGMVSGEIISFIFTIIYYQCKKETVSYKSSESRQSLLGEILNLGIPLTGNYLSVTLLQSLQSMLIPIMLTRCYGNHYYSIELYGIITGMALPFIQFPSTITGALATMLVPKVSAAKAEENQTLLSRSVKYPTIFCGIIGLCCFIGFISFGPILGEIIFHSEICGHYLRLLSFLCPFLYISGILTSILNGLGKTKITFFTNSISLGIQILFILFIVPLIGMEGYILGLLCSCVILVLLNLSYIKRSNGF